MNKLNYLPLNLKYLAVGCSRSNSDVGALVKGLYSYFMEGKRQSFENEGMQMLYLLFVNDIDDFVASKTKQSETNSVNAKGKKESGKSKSKSATKTETAGKRSESSIDEADATVTSSVNGNKERIDNTEGENEEKGDSPSIDFDAATDDDGSSVADKEDKPPEVADEKRERCDATPYSSVVATVSG